MRRAAAPAPLTTLAMLVAVVLRIKVDVASCDTLTGLGALLPSFISENFEELVKTGAATCEALPLEILFSREFTLELPQLDLVEFTRDGRKAYRVTRAHSRLRDHPIPSTLVLYIPGWWNTPTDESSTAIVNALLHKHPVILVLDTRLSFCRGYVSSASRVKPIAHLLYELIKNVYENIPVRSIHLIGFSLGAHVAGITGKLVQKRLKRQIDRITALDPAKPCFSRSTEYRLDKDDAKFVQVIHTSAGVLGLEQPIGHVDIYVNGVSIKQPECRNRKITLECDHARAWKLYSASVVNERSLMAQKCHSWEQVMSGKCSGDLTVVGYGCKTNIRGIFLHKSEGKKVEKQLQVFNPFDLLAWWIRR